MRASATLLTLCLTLSSAVAAAQPKNKGEGYQQAGAPIAFGCEVIATANTAKAIQQRGAVVRDACFAWGTLVRVKADGGKVNGALVMTSSVSFEAAVDTSRGHNIVDANGAGGEAAGFVLSDGETTDVVLGKDQLYRQAGARPGVCTGAITGPGKRSVRPPCRVDGDCSGLGAGTCTTPAGDELRRKSCGFLVVQVSAAATRVCWRVEE